MNMKETKTSRPVKILPDTIANRIAAGEVVERPASVVKELLENSIDAGASHVTVEIEQAGKERIRIVDDGCGMDKEDALASIERHATSKITAESDLFAIQSLGFRGEALPSIASVSLFRLTAKADAEEGIRITVEGGVVKNVDEVAFVRGCEVDVKKLFYNTPARRKFLKSDQAELAAITDTVGRIALANPDVWIQFSHNGRNLLNAQATDDLHERIAAVLGKTVYPKLFPIDGGRGDLRVTGMVSAPDLTKRNQTGIQLFLNGRAIRDRSLQHAVISAYGTMLESRRYPIAVVMLALPYDLVDVNVHPAKSEVRFSDSRIVYRLIHDAVREGLGRSPWLGGAGANAGYNMTQAPAGSMPDRVVKAMAGFESRRKSQSQFAISGGFGGATPSTIQKETDSPPENELPTGAGGFFSSLTVLSQLHKTYILVSTPNGLGIIDQHAAHERITFEKLRKAHRNRKLAKQMLLFPVRIDLNQHQLAALETFGEDVTLMGFEIEPFGGDSIQVRAVPELLSGSDPAALIADLLEDLADSGGSRAVDDRIDHCLSTMACHSSVRANDVLNYEQMLALLKQMDEIDFAAACPHGRPVFIEISHAELERRFGRTI